MAGDGVDGAGTGGWATDTGAAGFGSDCAGLAEAGTGTGFAATGAADPIPDAGMAVKAAAWPGAGLVSVDASRPRSHAPSRQPSA